MWGKYKTYQLLTAGLGGWAVGRTTGDPTSGFIAAFAVFFFLKSLEGLFEELMRKW